MVITTDYTNFTSQAMTHSSTISKMYNTSWPRIYSRNEGWINIQKSTNVIIILKVKSHDDLNRDIKKHLTKVNNMHGKITLNKLETEENFPQTTKNIYKNPKIILNNERLKCYFPKTRTRQQCLLLPLIISIV